MLLLFLLFFFLNSEGMTKSIIEKKLWMVFPEWMCSHHKIRMTGRHDLKCLNFNYVIISSLRNRALRLSKGCMPMHSYLKKTPIYRSFMEAFWVFPNYSKFLIHIAEKNFLEEIILKGLLICVKLCSHQSSKL